MKSCTQRNLVLSSQSIGRLVYVGSRLSSLDIQTMLSLQVFIPAEALHALFAEACAAV